MATLPKGQGVFLPPFKAWLASNIPAVYDNTMTYYEELVSLIKYLQDVIVPAINDNAEAITTLSETIQHLMGNVVSILSDLFSEALEKGDISADLGINYDSVNESITLSIAAVPGE